MTPAATVLSLDTLAALPSKFARRKELGPLFYSVFAAADRLDALGERATRQRDYKATLAKNLAAFERCDAILDETERMGLTLLPLKGALFADALYRDPGARPMADLDLAVQPRELAAALSCLERLGFRRLHAPSARFSPPHAHDVGMTDGQVFVDLHYRLFHELGADGSLARLFAGATRTLLHGRMRLVPSWQDHLVYTAVHAATHGFGEPALWPFDVALLVERGASVEVGLEEARRRHAGVAYLVAISLAHAALPASVPAPARQSEVTLRLAMVRQVLGGEPLAAAAAQLPSLVARALVTDEPTTAAKEIARKLALRGHEVSVSMIQRLEKILSFF